jgi:hypothetical protein
MREKTTKYPNVIVKLTGQDGNAFAILGACQRAARRAKLSESDIEKFKQEATDGDYNHLLQTCMKWFNIT